MFQPQPTPYSASSFASYPYGLGAAHSLDFLFPTGGAAGIAAGGVAGGAGVGASAGVGAGAGPGSALGPASCGALYNPYSSPSPHSHPALQQHHHQPLPQRRRLNRSGSPIIKMEEQDSGLHDMAAQQAAAERFQPGLEVRLSSLCWPGTQDGSWPALPNPYGVCSALVSFFCRFSPLCKTKGRN